MSEAPNTADGTPLTDEEKRVQLAGAISTVIRLSKELPPEVDPYADLDGPPPIDGIVDVSNHPAIHKAVESFKAAEAEVGIANAVVNIAILIAERFGIVSGA